MEQLKVAFKTLGCKLNFSESSTIARTFTDRGYKRVNFNEKADIYVINTCSVTNNADKKCRQIVKKAIKQSPEAFIAVVGCYTQLKPHEISSIKGVDLVMGVNEKFKLIEHLNSFEKKINPEIHSCEIDKVKTFYPSYSSGDRTRSFLKVQDGCDYPCTYCTIPKARGKSRNNSIEKTIIEAEKIAKLGFKEVILTGVNIGDFGKSTNEIFLELLKKLEKVSGIERFRISSIEPNLLTDEIIDFVVNSKKFLPHFHIPLQSGSDTILKLMKRRYNSTLYKKRIEKIKKFLPKAFIGVDVIIGFPGENEKEFNTTYEFLKNLDISFIHVFSYSERPNTETVGMPNKVDAKEIVRRSKMLHNLSEQKHEKFYQSNLGTESNVLFELQKHGNKMYGFTENYIKIEHEYNENLVNNIIKTILDSISESGNITGFVQKMD